MLVRTTVNHFRVERGCCRYGLLGVVHAERPFILPLRRKVDLAVHPPHHGRRGCSQESPRKHALGGF
jgi:hypothetical protein